MAIQEEQLERAVALAKAYGARRLILFGSALTRPEQARDLDLACDGIAGWKLTLDPGSVQALGLSEARAVTDAHGYYRFEDVVPGVHVIRVQDPRAIG